LVEAIRDADVTGVKRFFEVRNFGHDWSLIGTEGLDKRTHFGGCSNKDKLVYQVVVIGVRGGNIYLGRRLGGAYLLVSGRNLVWIAKFGNVWQIA